MMNSGIAVLALVVLATMAQADDYISPNNDRVRVSIGVMRTSAATDLQINSSAKVPGTEISGENDLGLRRANFRPKFQAVVRVATRHRLFFDYFTLDRIGNRTLTGTPIAFRNAILLPGDPVQTDLSLRMLTLTYGYSFWHGEKFELAGTLGINDTQISARARVQTETRHIDQRESQAGPFPTPGVDVTWALSKRFYLEGSAKYLRVAAQATTGSLGMYEFDAFYRYRPNVSFALGYNKLKAYLSATQSSQSGLFNFDAKGPTLFVRVAF